MGFLKSRETRRMFFIQTLLSAVSVIAAFLWQPVFGVFTLILCAVFLCMQTVWSFFRYKHVAELSDEIDHLLHGTEIPLTLAECGEGELAILRDEVYKMTVRLREQHSQLVKDKQYLETLVADISHQIRTPLTSANLLLSFLAEPELEKNRRLQLTRELSIMLSKIDRLLVTLLKLSKFDAGTVSLKKETVDLSRLIRTVTDDLSVSAELRGVNLISRANGTFTCDAVWTAEALSNIVKNCLEHTPAGGDICISAVGNPLYTEFSISDTGSGIDSADLPHIFDRFYNGKGADNNSFGIGLALAAAVISAQNGTIKVQNQSSGGVRFTIRFYKETI